MDTNNVILVDEKDNILWFWEKMDVHKKWLLHRAFSILIFNDKWELLLQQRAKEKYHCWWLWTNTVCSHPRPWESYENATHRRLQEEFWFDCDLEFKFNLLYNASFENWLIENEFDKVFVWYYDWAVNPNPEEIMDYKRVGVESIKNDMKLHPEKYTERFKLIIGKWI